MSTLAVRLGLMILLSGSHATTDAQKQIQAQYNRWSRAYMAHDVDTLLDILSPDYTLTSVDKDVMSYATYKAYLQLKRKTPTDATEYKTRILKLVQSGERVVTTSEETMTTAGLSPSGKRVLSIHKHVYLDTWVHEAKAWCLLSTVTQRESTVQRG